MSTAQISAGRPRALSDAFVHDEGLMNSAAVMGRAISRLTHARKMAWLMPRVARAVPYLGFILVSGTRPAPTGDA